MMSGGNILLIKSLHTKDPEVEENESRSDPSNLYTVNTDTPGKLKIAVVRSTLLYLNYTFYIILIEN